MITPFNLCFSTLPNFLLNTGNKKNIIENNFEKIYKLCQSKIGRDELLSQLIAANDEIVKNYEKKISNLIQIINKESENYKEIGILAGIHNFNNELYQCVEKIKAFANIILEKDQNPKTSDLSKSFGINYQEFQESMNVLQVKCEDVNKKIQTIAQEIESIKLKYNELNEEEQQKYFRNAFSFVYEILESNNIYNKTYGMSLHANLIFKACMIHQKNSKFSDFIFFATESKL